MNLITAPINENSPVPTIQNLQDGLLRLLQWFQSEPARESLLEEQQAGRYGGITKELVFGFQTRSELEGTGYVDRPTADVMNQLLRELGALDEPDRFVVRGILRLSDNTPVPGVEIQVFDRDLRSRELLAQTTTNSDGYYEITYTREQFSRAEKQTADLIVAAVELIPAAVAQYRTLVESPTLFNAPAIAEIDLTIAANIFQPPSEYVRLIQTLDGLLVNVAIADIEAPTLIDKLTDLNDEDLDFLFHETNIELEKLQFLTQSARLHQQFVQQDFSVPVPAFYGLARTKRINDLDGFARTSTSELKDGLIQAGGIPNKPQQNIITSFESEEQLDRIIETIHSVAIDRVLITPVNNDRPTPSQILATALPSIEHQKILLQTYANHDGTTEQFWDNLQQQAEFQESGQVERIQFALQLNTLTQSNLALVEQLQTQFQSTRSMAQMPPEVLTNLIKEQVPTPPADFPGDTPEEKLDLYTKSIVGVLQGAFPTETVAHVVSNMADTHLNNVAPTAISQFLDRASDRAVLETDEVFDLRSSHVDRFVALHGDRIFADIAGDSPQERLHQRTQITQQVKRTQRLFQVSTSPETLKILMESGFNSANQIAKQSWHTLKENLGDRIPDEELELIHKRAIATSAASLHTAIMAYQSATDISPAAIGNGLKEVPNWANLFGSLELCECQHCRSLYSPAAYFVDLLEFLRYAPPNPQGCTPLDVLAGNEENPHPDFPGKRPDLPHIQLTCENTNTPIPYIDLVNEVLESYVAKGKLDRTTAKDTGLSTAAELSANPQYVEDAAYDRLRDAVFPISLPFDRSLEMSRLYLDHLGSSRYEVMKAFDVEANRLASEVLGLSEREFEILTGKDFQGQDLQGVKAISTLKLYAHANDNLTPRLEFDPNQIRSGSAVVILQAKLKIDNPTVNLSLTGKYDDITQRAVIAFQGKFGLPADGIVDDDDWAVLEPLPPNAVGALIAGVPEFLHRTKLSYVELVDLLKTRFINPKQELLVTTDEFLKDAELTNKDIKELIANNFINPTPEIQEKLTKSGVTLEQIQARIEPLRSTFIVLYTEGSECELNKTFLQYLGGNLLTDADAWKIQRFIRLCRKLGWTMPELDNALFALIDPETLSADDYTGTISADCLQKLAQIKQFQTELNLSLPKLLSLWSNIETHGEKPLYNILFQNKAVFNPPDLDFRLNEKRNELADVSKALTGKQSAILAALRIKASELDAIIVDAQLPDTNLNLANLSTLYRYATLSKALRIPVQDLIAIKNLAGANFHPFTPQNPAPTLAFRELVQNVKTSGFLVPKLDYLFRNQVVLPSKFPPQKPSVEALLKTLRDGLEAIAKDNELPPEPDSELTRAKLGIIFSSDLIDKIIQTIEGTAVYTVSLNELPAEITTFPDAVKAKIRYERNVLSFTGAMSDDEQSLLLGLSPVDTYQAAINQLHQKPRDLLRQQDGTNEPKALADFLVLGLAEAELLNKPSLDAEGRPIFVDVNGNLTTAENAVTTAISAKFSYLLSQFLPYLQNILSQSLIQQTLSQSLKLDDSILKLLLTDSTILQADRGGDRMILDFLSLSTLASDRPLPSDTTNSYERLYKVAMLVNGFGFTAAEVKYWFSSDFAGINLNLLPVTAIDAPTLFEDWKKLAAYVTIRKSLPQGVATLIDVFQAEDSQKIDRLSELTSWRKVDIEQAINSLGLANAWSDVLNPFNLLKIQQIVRLSQTIGVSVDKLQSWTTLPLDADRAKEIKNAAKAKYNEEAWLEVSKPLSDKLREQQKSALIAYVLSLPDIRKENVTDSNRLFEYFLIDVEMCACMNTSRIKQAISSVQLFVQRCLLNLEPGVKPSAIDGDRWQWMKNYRVWEANRKVFLYPENWIEPELRDDKSPFFKELESELLQTDITDEAAEKALLNYLYKLDRVARLEVCGMYLQEETDGKYKSILHVFARTMGGAVRSYYYRRLLDNKEWTPWEKVELDINGVQGLNEKDFNESERKNLYGINLLPVVWNLRLYLFWLVLTQKAVTEQKDLTAKPNDGISIKIPEKYWEIKLAWSQYEQGKWLPKQISEQSYPEIISSGQPLNQLDAHRIQAKVNSDSLEINVSVRSQQAYMPLYSADVCKFVLNDGHSNVQLFTSNDAFFSIGSENSVAYFMGYKGQASLVLNLSPEKAVAKALTPVLDKAPNPYIFLPLNQFYLLPLKAPYFYQDGQHIYFVRSREGHEAIVRQVANPQKTSPFVAKEFDSKSQYVPSIPKPDWRMEKSAVNPWVMAEQELVVQKLTGFAARSGITLNQ
jgi:Neuraminidase-like domain/Putative peptidoglycan binding domain